MKKSQAPPKPPRPSLQKKVTVQASPIDEIEIRTIKDFTRAAWAVERTQEITSLTRQRALLHLCGCTSTDAQEAAYGLVIIPRDYVPYRRPYNKTCDAVDCNYLSIIKKYATAEFTIENLNVTQAFITPMIKKMKNEMSKKFIISMCKKHFFDNLKRDCPSCAQKFGLINCK